MSARDPAARNVCVFARAFDLPPAIERIFGEIAIACRGRHSWWTPEKM